MKGQKDQRRKGNTAVRKTYFQSDNTYLFLIMTAKGAKADMNKEAFEEEGEGRASTCPRDWLNINPDLFQ